MVLLVGFLVGCAYLVLSFPIWSDIGFSMTCFSTFKALRLPLDLLSGKKNQDLSSSLTILEGFASMMIVRHYAISTPASIFTLVPGVSLPLPDWTIRIPMIVLPLLYGGRLRKFFFLLDRSDSPSAPCDFHIVPNANQLLTQGRVQIMLIDGEKKKEEGEKKEEIKEEPTLPIIEEILPVSPPLDEGEDHNRSQGTSQEKPIEDPN